MQKIPITFILGSFLFLTFSPHYVDIFLNIYYLAAPGLSHGTRDFYSSL